jgi:multicomponent Na+:H+ antiporter subunit E
MQEIWAGLAVAALVSLFTLKMEPVLGDIRLTPKSLAYSVIYIFVFLKELVVSNIDVAGRVINPKLPIKPGIVRVKTKLNSRIAKTILANSITLTPGTLTVDIKDEYLYIHWIEIKHDDLEGATQDIVAKFEKYLEVIFV